MNCTPPRIPTARQVLSTGLFGVRSIDAQNVQVNSCYGKLSTENQDVSAVRSTARNVAANCGVSDWKPSDLFQPGFRMKCLRDGDTKRLLPQKMCIARLAFGGTQLQAGFRTRHSGLIARCISDARCTLKE